MIAMVVGFICFAVGFVSSAILAWTDGDRDADNYPIRYMIRGRSCPHCTKEAQVKKLRAKLEKAQAESAKLKAEIERV